MNFFKKIKSIEEVSNLSSSDDAMVEKDDLAIPDFNQQLNQDTSENIEAIDIVEEPINIPNVLAAQAVSASAATKAKAGLNLHPADDLGADDTDIDELEGDEPAAKLGVSQIIQSIVTVDTPETNAPDAGIDDNATSAANDVLGSVSDSQVEDVSQENISESVNTPETPSNYAEKLPSIISGTPAPAMEMPAFKTSKWPYFLLWALTILWLVAGSAAAYGYFELGLDQLSAEPIHALSFIGIIFVPACLLIILMMMIRRMNVLNLESQKLAYLNEQLLTPSSFSEKAAAHLSEAIAKQMDQIEQRADQAFHRVKSVQSAFAAQIDDVSSQLKSSAEQQTSLDSHLQSSKSSWAQSVKDTDQSITDLSGTLDDVLSSFQTRIQTTQDQMAQIGDMLRRQSQEAETAITPLFDRTGEFQSTIKSQVETAEKLRNEMSESLDGLGELISAQSDKLAALQEQLTSVKAETSELHTSWAEGEENIQDKIFTRFSEIDALNEKTQNVLKKINQPTALVDNTPPMALPLRGSLPQTHAANTNLGQTDLNQTGFNQPDPISIPSQHATLQAETSPNDGAPYDLVHEDIDPLDLQTPLNLQPAPQMAAALPPAQNETHTLSDERVFGEREADKKTHWFKRFGRQAEPQTRNADAQRQPSLAPMSASLSLRDALIAERLSPDALIDAGCVRRAVQLRLNEGPFAMSRYVSAHLGAAVDHLRHAILQNQVLKTQVHEISAAFPLRENLDGRNEEALNLILNSDSGREYLLCDAALNG